MTAARLFLVNGDVFPGDSGGPVFLASASRRLRLEGMVIRRLELSRGEHSPIALAVDAGAIRETVARLRRLPGW